MRDIKEIIKEIERRVEDYTTELRNSRYILENAPFIVEVNSVYTVGTDENGVIILRRTDYPSQFTKEQVKIICSLSFRDGKNKKVVPIVYKSNQWYKKELDLNKSLLNDLYKLV